MVVPSPMDAHCSALVTNLQWMCATSDHLCQGRACTDCPIGRDILLVRSFAAS